jgi:hypothetical protein
VTLIYFRGLGTAYFVEDAFCPPEVYELKMQPIHLKVEPVYKNVSI